MKQLSLIITILICHSAFTQDLKKDLEKMTTKYASATNLSLDVSVKTYSMIGSKDAEFQVNAKLRKSGNNFFYEMGKTQLCVNDKEMILINTEAKEMIVGEIDSRELKKYRESIEVQSIDSILKLADKYTYIGINEGVKHYSFNYDNGPVKQIDLFIDNESVLRKITYLYNKQMMPQSNYVEVNYTSVNFEPVINTSLFKSTSYFKKTGKDVYSGIGDYKDFLIIINFSN